MNLEGATFLDVDDVTVDSERLASGVACKVANRFLRSKGSSLEYTQTEFENSFQGIAFSRTLRLLAERHRLDISDDEHHALVAAEEHGVIEKMRCEGLSPAPHVEEILDLLQSNHHPVWFVSSSQYNRLLTTFEVSGLSRYAPPDRIISAQSHFNPPRPKPDPACYELALERSGVVREKARAVEDSISGVRASSAVMTTVAYIGLKNEATIASLIPRHRACGISLFLYDWRRYPELITMLNEGKSDEAARTFSTEAAKKE